MVVKVMDDTGFQNVPLISWPIKIALNSDQIQLAIMQNASPHHHRTTASWNGFLDMAALCYLHTNNSFISHVQKKTAFIRSVNLSPQRKIPSVVFLTPSQMCRFVCWCQKRTSDRPPGSVASSPQPVLDSPC